MCTVATSCQFIDLFDPVLVTMGGTQVQLDSAKTVTSEQGQLTSVENLTREDLLANLWVAGNIFLDNVLAFAEPTDLPPETAPPAEQPAPPPTGGAPTIAADAITAPAQYPPNGDVVVDQPNVQVGDQVAFRGSGCVPGETLSVLFDGGQVGTVPSDGGGNFAGASRSRRGRTRASTCSRCADQGASSTR